MRSGCDSCYKTIFMSLSFYLLAFFRFSFVSIYSGKKNEIWKLCIQTTRAHVSLRPFKSSRVDLLRNLFAILSRWDSYFIAIFTSLSKMWPNVEISSGKSLAILYTSYKIQSMPEFATWYFLAKIASLMGNISRVLNHSCWFSWFFFSTKRSKI